MAPTTTQYMITLLPTALLGICLLTLVYLFLKKEKAARQNEVLIKTRKEIIPLQMQAYERISLFLERISPESLIIREQSQKLQSFQLQSKLLAAIRTEYEHNMAMQIYITPNSWALTKNAKEEVIRLINTCSAQINPTSPSLELAKNILENSPNEVTRHINKGLTSIKEDVQSLLG